MDQSLAHPAQSTASVLIVSIMHAVRTAKATRALLAATYTALLAATYTHMVQVTKQTILRTRCENKHHDCLGTTFAAETRGKALVCNHLHSPCPLLT